MSNTPTRTGMGRGVCQGARPPADCWRVEADADTGSRPWVKGGRGRVDSLTAPPGEEPLRGQLLDCSLGHHDGHIPAHVVPRTSPTPRLCSWGPRSPGGAGGAADLSICSCCVSGSRAAKVATRVPGGAPSARLTRRGFSGNTGASLVSCTHTLTLACPRTARGAAACSGAWFCTSTWSSWRSRLS